MRQPLPRYRQRRRGYVMLIALVLFGALTALGATVLRVSSVDERSAYHNIRYLKARHASHAGIVHAETWLMFNTPGNDGWSSPETGWTDSALQSSTAGSDWMYAGYPEEQPQYQAFIRYERCSTAPAGFSAEIGSRNRFRTDYYRAMSNGILTKVGYQARAEARALVSKAVKGECKIR